MSQQTAEVKKSAGTAALSDGTLEGGIYRNTQLGLTFSTPKGWIAQGTTTRSKQLLRRDIVLPTARNPLRTLSIKQAGADARKT